jgi:hypothetical protein
MIKWIKGLYSKLRITFDIYNNEAFNCLSTCKDISNIIIMQKEQSKYVDGMYLKVEK